MQLSGRIDRLSPSPIREILKAANRPEVISFAGGLPSAESFPEISSARVSRNVLQYGASEGEATLRQRIAKDLNDKGLHVTPEQVLVLSGSQQGIDLVAKLVIDSGTRVAVEAPTYLAALQVFSLFGASYLTYNATDYRSLQSDDRPRLIYTVPTFQNPTGHCYSNGERRALAACADELDCILFEDDPYRDLVYTDCDRTPVCSFIESTSWVYQSSFSKTFAPGLRLGYLVCSEDLYDKLVWLKQAADLHSNRLSQSLVLDMLSPDQNKRLQQVVSAYRRKRDQFHTVLQQKMAPYATWSEPAGGLFFWLTLKHEVAIDVDELLQQALERNVLFMPGSAFFTEPQSRQHLRLNFSHATYQQMQAGLSILAELISASLQQSQSVKAPVARSDK